MLWLWHWLCGGSDSVVVVALVVVVGVVIQKLSACRVSLFSTTERTNYQQHYIALLGL